MAITSEHFSQLYMLKTSGVKDKDNKTPGGVCLELCRRFILGRVVDTWKPGDIKKIKIRDMEAIYKAHKPLAGYRGIPGVESDIETFRKRSLTGFRDIGGRADVIWFVLENPGWHLYIVDLEGFGAHSFAFDTTDLQDVLFLDPNQGEWRFANENLDTIINWWIAFWEGKHEPGPHTYNYSRDYKKSYKSLSSYVKSG